VEASAGRISIKEAAERLEDLGRHLDEIPGIERWAGAGSLRRRKETVGDLDLLIQAADRGEATRQILEYPAIAEVLARGEEKVFVRLDTGLEVDFRFFEQESFGAAMLYFTGSKAHNIELRKRIQRKEWKLNEYGLYQGSRRLAGETEEEIYQRVGLAWIPPELRENRGELQAAAQEELSRLVTRDDIRGELHAHTDASDGVDSLDQMAAAARELGYGYLAITDHSPAVRVTRGLDEKRLARQVEAIHALDRELDDLLLLSGIEVDILKDGSLDLPRRALEDLDWVVASVHSYFNLSKKEMTRRVVRAVESGVVHCLGHPLGRMIGSRDPLDLDLEPVFRACREHDVALEINSHPNRLDLPDIHCREARDQGVALVITTDAHRADNLHLIEYGVGVARRGWLKKKDVLNTLSPPHLAHRLGIQR